MGERGPTGQSREADETGQLRHSIDPSAQGETGKERLAGCSDQEGGDDGGGIFEIV